MQNFLAANSKCWWNTPLTAATRALKYAGHVSPGMLLVTAEPCALEILRGAYARSVLKPPATYIISSVGEYPRYVVEYLKYVRKCNQAYQSQFHGLTSDQSTFPFEYLIYETCISDSVLLIMKYII